MAKNTVGIRPNVVGKAFLPLNKLSDMEEGVMDYSRVTILPQTAFTGATTGFTGGTRLPNKLVFQYSSPGGRAFTDLSKWWIRVRVRFSKNAAGTTALRPGDDTTGLEVDNLQLARFGFANAIENSMLSIASRTIDNVSDVPQVTSLRYLASRSKSWMESAAGSPFQTGPDGVLSATENTVDPGRRIVNTGYTVAAGDVQDVDMLVKLPNALFWEERLVRLGGANYTISCDIKSDWDQRIVYSATSGTTKTVSTAGTHYFARVISAELSIPTYEPMFDIPIGDMYLAEAAALTLLKEDITASSSITRTLVTPPSPSKAIIGLQSSNMGSDARTQQVNFLPSDLNTVQVRWSGKTQPSQPYDIDYDVGRYREPMLDTMMSLGQYAGPGAISGASLEEDEWRSRYSIYAFDLVAAPGARNTNLEVRATAGTAFTGQLMCGVVSGLWVLFMYNEGGLMQGIEVFESRADLAAAIAS